MRWISLALALSLLAIVPAGLATETSHEATSETATDTATEVHLTAVAKEDGCAEDAAFCYEVTEGSLDEIEPGSHVTVTFENHGEAEHELMVRTLDGVQIAPAMGPMDGHMEANSTDHDADAHGDDPETQDDGHGEDANATGHEADGHGDNATESQDHQEANESGHDDPHDAEASSEEDHRDDGHGEMSAGGHADHLVPPGGQRTITFTVPQDAQGIYLWCSLPGHEEAGMWEEQAFGVQSAEEHPAPDTEPLLSSATASMIGIGLAVAGLLVGLVSRPE